MNRSQTKILKMLAERYPEPVSGADIINEHKMFSGTMYPILYGWEESGLLASEWRGDTYPRSKVYSLTEAGMRCALERFGALAQ